MTLTDIFVSEVIGTALLILLGAGVVANVVLPKNKGFNAGWVVITFGWGLAVYAGVWAAWKSGAHLNPAVTFGIIANGQKEYVDGIPEGSRATQGKSLSADLLSEGNIGHLRVLNAIAENRGQTLAQMALAWVLRDQGDASVTTVLIGASSTAQLDDNLGALGTLEFSAEELAAIDEHGGVEGINLWQGATDSVK